MTRARSAVAIPAAYITLSVLLWLLGWLRGDRILDDVPVALYLGAQILLGPLAFALDLGAGIPGPNLTALWVILYLAASLLLWLCRRLVRWGSAWARTLGIAASVLIWLACGALNAVLLLRGI